MQSVTIVYALLPLRTHTRTRLFQVNERFNVTLRADPCNFNAYDLNRDTVITKFEFQAIFGSDENTRNLFNALDMTTGEFLLLYFYLGLIFKKGQDCSNILSHLIFIRFMLTKKKL